MPHLPVDFTDGDTFKRVTVTSPGVTATSKILVTVQKAVVLEADEEGWIYVANVASVGTDTFDVNVAAAVLGETPINDEGPNETITLVYAVV